MEPWISLAVLVVLAAFALEETRGYRFATKFLNRLRGRHRPVARRRRESPVPAGHRADQPEVGASSALETTAKQSSLAGQEHGRHR
jgi:hypothetical protein